MNTHGNGSTDHQSLADERFDAAMRAHHARAIDNVSPRVAAQLQLRRRAALAGTASTTTSTRRRFGWPMGAAVGATFAALLAVAIGIQMPPSITTQSANTPMAIAANLADDDGDTLLDENPDFYLWLASSDAGALAME
ncbi:MAG: hypothetical protein ACREO8_02170 [Luteimonas sp.]